MGTWSAPHTTEQAEKLRELMKQPLINGKEPSDNSATSKLYHLVGDDELFDRFAEYASDDDVRSVVMSHLQDWFGITGDNDDLRKSWGWKKPFDDGALVILKEMLTDWHNHEQYPSTKG